MQLQKTALSNALTVAANLKSFLARICRRFTAKESSIPKDEWQAGIDYNEKRFDALVGEIERQITLSGLGFLFWERFKLDYPEELFKDETDPSQKLNKLLEQGIGHHGLEKLRSIAGLLLKSPHVRGIPNSCDNQPRSRAWIKPLSAEEARCISRGLQSPSASSQT